MRFYISFKINRDLLLIYCAYPPGSYAFGCSTSDEAFKLGAAKKLAWMSTTGVGKQVSEDHGRQCGSVAANKAAP